VSPPPPNLPAAAQARRQAAAILHESRFRGSSVPRPLHGLLQTIGAGLRDPAHAISRAVDDLGRHLPGGRPVAWALVAILLAGAVGLIARFAGTGLLGRRSAQAGGGSELGPRAPTTAELLLEAERAEREGRWEPALRLRFRAGLAGLADREGVRSPASRTSGELSRALGSADFDALAGRFDEIVYGGRAAADEDVEDARRRWPLVLARGQRR
jgi:hypothetical protein